MKCGSLRDELMEVVVNGSELASPAMQDHLATCPACVANLASLRQTMELLDEWQTPEPSPYFSARLRARMRDEQTQAAGWLAWLRRPAVVTAAAALMAVGVGLLEGAHWKSDHQRTVATTVNAVGDLQY